MASFFTWLDLRPDDAHRVREALAALEAPGTLDPLGLGVVRDGFSDLLFPGLSTVMTRARYFLFVPWVYQQVDSSTRGRRSAKSNARDLEVDLIIALLEGSANRRGIIGQNSRRNTKQLPSMIYWGGLGRLGIRRFSGNRSDYLATVASRARNLDRGSNPWHPSLPTPPGSWLSSATLDLAPEEAEFLRDRILTAAPHTFFSTLARDATSPITPQRLWDDPHVQGCPPAVQQQIHHAKLFAIVTWGAGLLYNIELARLRTDDHDETTTANEQLARDFARWSEWIEEIFGELVAWNRDAMWATAAMANGSVHTARPFVDWWIDLAISKRGGAIDTVEVRRSLRAREIAIKGTRAKLASRRAREQSQGMSGEGLMSFRWPTARAVISDIVEATA